MDIKERNVGRFTLQPFRQLLERGHPVPVKPKALAILSVLAEADGTLVTKDELMAAVWPNITVEDNAIQVHVASLRKILGADAELLCTVHGHGYRLAPTRVRPGAISAPPGAVPPALARPRWAALALVLAVSAAVASLWFFRNGTFSAPTKPTAQVAILPFDLSAADAGSAGFSHDLRDSISSGLSDAQILTVFGDTRKSILSASRQADAEFLLGGRIRSDGKTLDIHVQLRDAQEGVSLWSGTFRKPVAERSALLPVVATAVADAAHFAVIGRTGKVRLKAAGVAALIEARESMTTVSRPNPLLQMADYKKIIAMAPDFSWAHSGLAVADGFQLRADPQNEALRSEAVREANRALELEPANGEAYLGLELALPRFNWQQREALLLKGIKADPGFSPGAVMEGRLLSAVGRNKDALFWYRRAYNIDPLLNNNSFVYAATLMAEGFPKESQKILEQMDAQWPQHIATRNAHFWTSLISGAQSDMLAILTDAARWPVGMNQKSAAAWRLALTARHAKTGSADERALQAVKDMAAEGSLNHGEALLLLSMLGDLDGAFAQAEEYLPSDPQWGPLLFLEPTWPMRQDRRFIALAVKYGFAAYWRSTGQWPDFCKAPDLAYDCRKEVDKALAAPSGEGALIKVRSAAIPY